jgi:hypothetical protein
MHLIFINMWYIAIPFFHIDCKQEYWFIQFETVNLLVDFKFTTNKLLVRVLQISESLDA